MGNPEDRFPCVTAQIIFAIPLLSCEIDFITLTIWISLLREVKVFELLV